MTDRRDVLRSILGLPLVSSSATAAAAGLPSAVPDVDTVDDVIDDASTLLVFRVTERLPAEHLETLTQKLRETMKHFSIAAPAILLPHNIEFEAVRLTAKDRTKGEPG